MFIRGPRELAVQPRSSWGKLGKGYDFDLVAIRFIFFVYSID